MNEKLKAILEIIGVLYLIFSSLFTLGYFWYLIGKRLEVPFWAILISFPAILICALLLAITIIAKLTEG